MKKLMATGVALVTSISVFTVVQAAPASAAVRRLGLWEHDNYGGKKGDFFCAVEYYEDLGSMENQASSMSNGTKSGIDMYSGDHGLGTRYYAKPNSSDGDFTNNNFDNTVESIYFRDSSATCT